MEMMKRAREMFLDAAAGAVFGSTCDSFLEWIEKCSKLDIPVLDRVKSTVESLELCIPKMEDHDMTFEDELKEEMKRARKFLDKLSEDNELMSWSKTSDNNQLVELDASLKSQVGKLRLQLATEVLGLGKGTKRKPDEVDQTVKAGFFDIQKRQDDMLQKMMKKLERKDLANQVDPLNEGAALVDGLGELDDLVQAVIARSSLQASWVEEWYVWYYHRIRRRTELTFGLVEEKTAENKAIDGSYTGWRSTGFQNVDKGRGESHPQVRNCPEVAAWTDELKLEYTNKFIDLNKTLEALYYRLAGIRPLQWNCGTSIQDSAIKTTKDFIIHGN